MTCDPEHKFELAIQLGDLKTCYQIAKEAEVREFFFYLGDIKKTYNYNMQVLRYLDTVSTYNNWSVFYNRFLCCDRICSYFLRPCYWQSEQKWKQLAELAISKCEFGLAQECLHQASDFGGLLLLASSAGNAQMVAKLGDTAQKAGQNNVAFVSHFVLGRSVTLAMNLSKFVNMMHIILLFYDYLLHTNFYGFPYWVNPQIWVFRNLSKNFIVGIYISLDLDTINLT